MESQNTIEEIRAAIEQIKRNDIMAVILAGNLSEVIKISLQDLYDTMTIFTHATSIVRKYLELKSIGIGYNPYKMTWRIASMFYHDIWSQYSLVEAVLNLHKKGKRDDAYLDEIVGQFIHDVKAVFDFIVEVSENKTPDTIQMYENKKLKTYKAVVVGTQIKVIKE